MKPASAWLSAARALLACAIGLAFASPATAVPDPGPHQYRFRVYLDNMPVGYHQIRVQSRGETVHVETDARFDVRLMSVPVYHYLHRATEQWRSGCLRSLVSSTDENGRPREVQAGSDGDQLRVVSSTRGEETLSGCVLTYAYWNPGLLRGATHLLNPQTGEYKSVRTIAMPDETIDVRGKSVLAHHIRIDTGRHDIHVWYSQDGQWLGLETVIALGRRLRYRPE